MLPHKWVARVCSGVVGSVLDLYTDDGVLIPTYDKSDLPGAGTGVLIGRRYMEPYFRRFMAKKNLCGAVKTVVQQQIGPVPVMSGIYSFTWDDVWNRRVSADARYTFVIVPSSAGQMIATHHSSKMPGS